MVEHHNELQVKGKHGVLFARLPAYVPAFRDRNAEARVVIDLTEAGCVVVCFASKIDAFIAATYLRRAGRYCTAVPASTIPAQQFRDADGRGLVVDVHLGWAICAGLLLIRGDWAGSCTTGPRSRFVSSLTGRSCTRWTDCTSGTGRKLRVA